MDRAVENENRFQYGDARITSEGTRWPVAVRSPGASPASATTSPIPIGGTRRRFNPNIQRKRFWLPNEQRYVRLTVSAKGIKTIDKCGIEAIVADIRARGGKV
jgi:large subunit ribosomal protein L28